MNNKEKQITQTCTGFKWANPDLFVTVFSTVKSTKCSLKIPMTGFESLSSDVLVSTTGLPTVPQPVLPCCSFFICTYECKCDVAM